MVLHSTPTHAKRARQDANGVDSPSAVSAKRRRLDTGAPSSPSTPNALKAISSAISRASARRVANATRAAPNRLPGAAAKGYEIPDSDEDAPGSGIGGKKAVTAGRPPAKSLSRSIYDVPSSDNELDPLASPMARDQTTEGFLTLTPVSKKTPVAKRLASAAKGSRSTSKKIGGPEDRQEPTTRQLPSAKERRDLSVPQPSTNGAPELRGILTPSKRGEKRSRKSVAFEGEADRSSVRAEEVHFEDLPGKPSKTSDKATGHDGSGAKSGSKQSSGKAAGAKPSKDKNKDEVEAVDDEVCVICSLPDSEPPNEILFCDNCDKGYHQECSGIAVIPEGDWVCEDCSGESPGAGVTEKAGKDEIPEIVNFGEHLCALQRLLIDRCTGRRKIRLRGQEEAYGKAFQLVKQTVLAGEGNSMLVIGARGCGKTLLMESVISELSSAHKDDFHVVRLNGFIHTDDKIALKEIWRQLGKEMEVGDDLINKTNNYADTLASLLAVLSHPSEIAGADSGVTSKSVVFVMDEFDLFATHARQTLLYNLFDIAQARKAPIAVVGLTTRVDVVETLEKRVKSRFSHRYVYLSLPKTLGAYWDICRQGIMIDHDDPDVHKLSSPSLGRREFLEWWKQNIEALRQEPGFKDHLEFHYYSSKSVSAFYNSCILPLSLVSRSEPRLRMHAAGSSGLSVEGPGSKLVLLESLSDLDLALLIAAARLDIVAHTDTVNFSMAYDEYTSLMGRQRVMSATSGAMVIGGGARTWGRGVAGIAWEHLASVGLLTPASGVGRSSAGNMGLEAKMWKVDVALEEIPVALKPSSILARWCREI